MWKIKKTSKFIILTIIFVTYFIIPSIGIQLNNSDPLYLNEHDSIKINSSISSSSSQITSNNIDLKTSSEKIDSKYGSYLKAFLTNITLDKFYGQKDIDIIVHFKSSLLKEERINVIDSVFNNYILIKNYDLIPGIHLKVNPNQLIEKESIIDNQDAITKIFKSKIYQYPYLQEEDLHINALDKDYYSNWWLSAIGAEDLPYNGSGVKVAVIDTGIYTHPDLTIINNRNFVTDELASNFDDDVGHGTHVAGIIAGNGGGSSGKYRGVAPGVLLINARAGNASGLSEVDVIDAIEWSSKPTTEGGAGADIISMSFGGGYPIISDSITDAISTAKSDYGVIFVASAGNSGPEYFTGSTPGSGVDTIAVGATNENDKLASFSSWGPTFRYIGYPDVVAPGVNIISTESYHSVISDEKRYKGDFFDFAGDADYIPLSGTSMSCPVVAGALAILLEAFPNITPETARIALLEGARKIEYEDDGDILKSGAGIINVTASLNYLNSISPDYNNISKIYPDVLPVKPYDLLNFPGDHQKFNLTIISGMSNIIDIEIPNNIQGVSLSIDKSTITFTESGIGFIELDIKIDKDALPGIRNFQINITGIGSILYDIVEVTLDIRLPEYRILMESYHGLNDWFPDPFSSFYQIGFYEAMADLSDMNISIDYGMEFWTPNYDSDLDNSILTEERLAQYDLILLQNPILPYSPLEIENLEKYFDNGGNLLFLGTRYQDMLVDNINYLFSRLGVNIQMNEENLMNDEWLGIGISLDSQSVNEFDNLEIFNGVSKFYWRYGNSFTVSSNAESIASINSTTVAALYNGTQYNKGKFLAFGDLHWIFNKYTLTSYSQDHKTLLKNLIEFLLPEDDISINIDLTEDRISDPEIGLSIYLKNQTLETPINISQVNGLDITLSNTSFSEHITLNTTFSENGIYFNNSYQIPYPSSSPYTIKVNVTIGSKNYIKTSKILFFKQGETPQINDLTSDLPSNDLSLTRISGDSTNLIAEINGSTDSVVGFLSIYSYSFYNTKKSINKTLSFSYTMPFGDYRNNFDPFITDPSGYAIYYIIPSNSNYTDPNSPRYAFVIVNNDPQILKTTSKFNYDGTVDVNFDDTESDDGSYVYSATQGNTFNFEVDVSDTEESDNSNLRAFVNLFIGSTTEDGFIMLIFPDSIEVAELNYQPILDHFEGSFVIPDTMLYDTISGTKSVSTAAGYDFTSNRGYLGILFITVYDSEGGYDDFIIILIISERPIDYSLIIIIVISIIALLGFVGMIIYYTRRKKYPRTTRTQPAFQEYYYPPSYETQEEGPYITSEPLSQLGQFYCPFCGKLITTPKKFCPHCGESLLFSDEDQ